MGGSCRGWITPQPDHYMFLNTPFGWLRIFVRSGGDTTLVVVASRVSRALPACLRLELAREQVQVRRNRGMTTDFSEHSAIGQRRQV